MLDLSVLATVATVLASLFVSFYLYARYKQTYWQRRGVYSPPAHWLFGHFRDAILLRSTPPTILGDIHNQHEDKPVVGIYVLQKPFLLVRDPIVMKHIMIKDFHLFSDRYFGFKRKTDLVGNKGLFAIDNPEWKYLRMKLSPAFTTGKQKKLFELMLERAENMREYLKREIVDGQKINVECRTLVSKFTADIISSLTFGISTNSFDKSTSEFYERTRRIFAQDLSNTFKLFINFFFPYLGDYVGGNFLREHEGYYRKIFWESMNKREKSGVQRGDLIDFLLQLKNEDQTKEFRFEGDHLFAQSAVMFAAGMETSAITMSFAPLELAKHPDIQARVRAEIAEKVGEDGLTYERISEMNYLHQVMSETLRLHPPAPLLDRVALEDYKVPGTDIVIEKGTAVNITLKGIHENPDYHPDPLKFDPERFSETRKQDIKPCTYMPFGEGPRICIGMRTAMLQTTAGMITILSEYEVSLNPKFANEISKRAIFTAPSNGINLYFKRTAI